MTSSAIPVVRGRRLRAERRGWRTHAEVGRDAVAEQVKERREAEPERLKAQRDELIRRAQEAERDKRRAVIEEALKRRAEKRVADSRPPMKLGPTF